MTERCETCRFYFAGGNPEASKAPETSGDGQGACRRYPPAPTDLHDYFPQVHSQQWCGEYEAKQGREP